MPGSGSGPEPQVNVVHSLLRARDWQDRLQFVLVCDQWRNRGRGMLAVVGIGEPVKTAIANRIVSAVPGLTEQLRAWAARQDEK